MQTIGSWKRESEKKEAL
ncbi:hypothetical protein RO1_32400 [Roseburia intestinalis XB6B4]|uniref:Uncharacterized protein n=1 Tax=Roseburia intestinalis XB6B4 TaxID=718255 RepID=D4L1S3_9FIRM|nr:hypothetical protein RO1_32400 [Roseburia intestinalis XB6B4]